MSDSLREIQTRVLESLGNKPEERLLKQLFSHIRREVWEHTIIEAKADILKSFSGRLAELRSNLQHEEAQLVQRSAAVRQKLGTPAFEANEIKAVYAEAVGAIKEAMMSQITANADVMEDIKAKARRLIKRRMIDEFADKVAAIIIERDESAFAEKGKTIRKIRNRVFRSEAKVLREQARLKIIENVRKEMQGDGDLMRQVRIEAREAIKAEIESRLRNGQGVVVTREVEDRLVQEAVNEMRQRFGSLFNADASA